MRQHWKVFAAFLVAAILIFVGSIYVFLWYVSMAQSSGMVPSILGLWSFSHLVTFIIYLVFWELLLIGIPTVVVGILGWQLWWNKLAVQERTGLEMTGRKRTAGGSGFSFLFFIVFAIKVYLDGKWHDPIATFTLDYVVSSMITILIGGVLIIGVPALFGLTWSLSRGMKKPLG